MRITIYSLVCAVAENKMKDFEKMYRFVNRHVRMSHGILLNASVCMLIVGIDLGLEIYRTQAYVNELMQISHRVNPSTK